MRRARAAAAAAALLLTAGAAAADAGAAVTPEPIRTLSLTRMRLTQRIGQAPGHVQVTAQRLFVNQRIAQAALWRVTQAEATAEASGVLTPPD